MLKYYKKIIAPIIITILVVLYYFFLFATIIDEVDSMFLKILLAILPITLGVAMVYVCVQRIKEIKGGEEDDLDNY